MPNPVIPAWLLETERYVPRPDRDAFLDRTLQSFLRLLSRMRASTVRAGGGIALHPAVRLSSTLLLVLLLSLSHSLAFVTCAGAILLGILSLHRGEVILRVLKTSLPITGLTLVILLPSALWGNFSSIAMISAKVFVSVSAMKLLAATTPWADFSRGLAAFRVPDLFILVLDITVRYLVLLGGFSLSMVYALKLRSVGRNDGKAASLAGIGGTLFLASRKMAEDLSAAMECRCFIGTYRGARAVRLSARDLVPAAIDTVLLLVFFIARA